MDNHTPSVHGAGLGLRRALLGPLTERPAAGVDFLELAPENWMGRGGTFARALSRVGKRYPLVCHGLSLSLGGPDPLDEHFLRRVEGFLSEHRVELYSEHLSYCAAGGHLYDLMPLPFTEEAIRHTAARIRRTQEILGRRIAVENISYYAAPSPAMPEVEFINAVINEADCDLLLDVNNLYVNSINHGYDPDDFLAALPGERIAYLHVAGHYREAEDLLVDTHGAAVIDPVWSLLEAAYARFGVRPTLLERDFNLPPLDDLLAEVDAIAALQRRGGGAHARQANLG